MDRPVHVVPEVAHDLRREAPDLQVFLHHEDAARAAGRAAASAVRRDLAVQMALAMERAPIEALEAVVERCPSVARYPIGMRSPRIRTALRSGDIEAWDLDR